MIALARLLGTSRDPSNPSELRAGALPSFTSIGCYPVFYFVTADTRETFRDASCWCPKCCNTEEDEDLSVVAAEVNWEDPDLTCEQCGERIESAYAEPEQERKSCGCLLGESYDECWLEPVACWTPGCYLAVDEHGTCETHGKAPR